MNLSVARKRLLAGITGLALISTSIGLGNIIVTANNSAEGRVITAFEELPEETAFQVLPLGASEKDINFPSELNITLYAGEEEEKEPGDGEEVVELPPEEPGDDQPGEDQPTEDEPVISPGTEPGEEPGGGEGEILPGIPEEGPVEAPVEDPVEAPVEDPVEAPVETPSDPPAETPEEPPVQAPEDPPETPEETPVQEPPEETPEVIPSEEGSGEGLVSSIGSALSEAFRAVTVYGMELLPDGEPRVLTDLNWIIAPGLSSGETFASDDETAWFVYVPDISEYGLTSDVDLPTIHVSFEKGEPEELPPEDEDGTVSENEPEETVSENEPEETVSENEPEETVSENEPEETVSENEPEETVSGNEPYPAFSAMMVLGGIRVTVEAPEGVFPGDAVLNVRRISDGEITEKIAETLSDDPEKGPLSLISFDITITDAEGNELQPADPDVVKVTFSNVDLLDEYFNAKNDEDKEENSAETAFHVWHLNNSLDSAEELSASLDEKENAATVTAPHFSTYTLGLTGSEVMSTLGYMIFRASDPWLTDLRNNGLLFQYVDVNAPVPSDTNVIRPLDRPYYEFEDPNADMFLSKAGIDKTKEFLNGAPLKMSSDPNDNFGKFGQYNVRLVIYKRGSHFKSRESNFPLLYYRAVSGIQADTERMKEAFADAYTNPEVPLVSLTTRASGYGATQLAKVNHMAPFCVEPSSSMDTISDEPSKQYDRFNIKDGYDLSPEAVSYYKIKFSNLRTADGESDPVGAQLIDKSGKWGKEAETTYDQVLKLRLPGTYYVDATIENGGSCKNNSFTDFKTTIKLENIGGNYSLSSFKAGDGYTFEKYNFTESCSYDSGFTPEKYRYYNIT
ncbi:MAG: glutamate-rich protein 5, partial [Lachnospiraceae bacterium]|nr:glutamate-rich protein 5 [Lachnospiraceae bacterium]